MVVKTTVNKTQTNKKLATIKGSFEATNNAHTK
jgi:hypothetical protein